MRNIFSSLMLISCFLVACTSEMNANTPSKKAAHADTSGITVVNQIASDKNGISAEKGRGGDDWIVAVSKDKKITVSMVPEETVSTELSGCGCGFYPPEGKPGTIIGWLEQESPEAIMKINGKLEKFSLNQEWNQRAGGPESRPESGDKTTFHLSSAKYETAVECQVSGTCWGKDGCEYIDYKCAVTTKSADGSLTIPAIGTCGC